MGVCTRHHPQFQLSPKATVTQQMLWATHRTHTTHATNKQTQQLFYYGDLSEFVIVAQLVFCWTNSNAYPSWYTEGFLLRWYCPGSCEAWLQWGLHKFPTAAKLVQFSLEELHGIHHCQASSHSNPFKSKPALSYSFLTSIQQSNHQE